METIYDRTELLIGSTKLEKIKNAKVCVFGVGGVGGYAVECLARAGVGEITLVDFDVVSVTNINRQLIALSSNIGKFKVDEYKKRIKKINSQIKVNAIKEKLTAENIEKFNLSKFNFVLDAIDDVKAKVVLAKFCSDNKTSLVSAMGSGNKYFVPEFKVVDIFKTEGDMLARKMRHELKNAGVKKLDCVFCATQTVERKNKNVVASISYYPAAAGVIMSAYVLNKIMEC